MPTLVSADRVFGVPGADAVLTSGGRIASVGSRAELVRPSSREERFPGGTIIAGLADAHFHPVGYTGALQRVSLKSAEDFDGIVDRLRDETNRLAPEESLIGVRLDDEALVEQALPTRHDLDAAASDRPVLIYRYCGHIAVANTRALEVARITAATADPAGGSLDRDSSGVPNGILRETAIALVSRAVGDRASGLTSAQVAEASRHLAAAGLTALGAMVSSGEALWCDGADEIAVLVGAAPELALPMSVLVATESPEELEAAAALVGGAGRRLRFCGVKLFADGSLGGHTAAMFEPFADQPHTRGTHRLSMEVALPVATRSIELGGMVAIHAIGDAAVSDVLDIFERLLDAGADPGRLRMEHVSVIRDADVERMAAMGVTASVQPAFLASESDWLEKRLGPSRMSNVYRFATLAGAGVPIAGGSDCPVEPPHPLHGIAAAVHRHGIQPGEALSPSAAMRAFTSGVAAAIGMPEPLSVGSPANLTVVDGNPEEMSPAQLRSADVMCTFIDGEPPPLPASGFDWVG